MARSLPPPGPTPSRENNLGRMKAILASNLNAMRLAETLWYFFGCRLGCNPPKPAGSSKIIYGFPEEYALEFKAHECTPLIGLAESDRVEEALVHELLHLDLVRQGYPRFWIENPDGVSKGITNNADHVVMRPRFIALGYSADRFVTLSELTELDRKYLREIDALSNLHTPEGYTASVSAYLSRYGYRFRPTYVR